jgi:hypothetical protein
MYINQLLTIIFKTASMYILPNMIRANFKEMKYSSLKSILIENKYAKFVIS